MIASDSEALNPGASSETWAAWATGSTTELTVELPEQPLSAITRPVTATAQATSAEVGSHLPPIGRNNTARRYMLRVYASRERVSWLCAHTVGLRRGADAHNRGGDRAGSGAARAVASVATGAMAILAFAGWPTAFRASGAADDCWSGRACLLVGSK